VYGSSGGIEDGVDGLVQCGCWRFLLPVVPQALHDLAQRGEVNAGTRRTKRCDGSDTDAMTDLWDETDDGDVSPICTACGVSALPPEVPGEPSSCENPNCSEFGEPMGS